MKIKLTNLSDVERTIIKYLGREEVDVRGTVIPLGDSHIIISDVESITGQSGAVKIYSQGFDDYLLISPAE